MADDDENNNIISHVYDAFTTANLWKPSQFFQDPSTYESTLFAPVDFDVSSVQLNNPYAPSKPLDRELRLPDLDTFEFGPLPELESLTVSSISDGTEQDDDAEEIWEQALDLGPSSKDVQFWTWESFENAGHVEHRSPYISEAGPQSFDAALQQQDRKNQKSTAGRSLKPNVLLDSLLNLGLGRSSILFRFDPKKRSFVSSIEDGKITGTSLDSAQSLIKQFVATGNTFLWLRSFVENTFISTDSISARVALATAISAILSAFEKHLGKESRDTKSLLQLERLFSKPRTILFHIARMVDAVKSAKSNEALSSTLFQRIQAIEENDPDFLELSKQILAFVARPSLELLSEWIGLKEEGLAMPVSEKYSFAAVENNYDNNGPEEYAYNPEGMPRFISDKDGESIFQMGNSLRFLKTHHPEHPFVCLRKAHVQPPELKWNFEWQALHSISAKAKAYEESLRKAIQEFSLGPQDDSRISGASNDSGLPEGNVGSPSEDDPDQYVEDYKRLFDKPPDTEERVLPDELYSLLDRMLRDDPGIEHTKDNSFPPPLSVTPMLSFSSILAAQAALVNAVTLRLFFRSHHLMLHLSLQKQYHLFGDGVFSSRLASALFDPERETAERRKGTMRSGVHMGLQLGARSTWPPASSELRLALMGVLSESYHSSALFLSTLEKGETLDAHSEGMSWRRNGELPGQLNFAIRQLTEPEMERVMDPDSLYALDFLRLQYVPPSPLHLVITSGSLEKYDQIFKFLLRLLRMVFVVSHLPRRYSEPESRHFRNEAHHFVTAISSYVFNTGISQHWSHLGSFVGSVEKRLREEDESGQLGRHIKAGLDNIKGAHEHCLDSIMFALLLRRRQKKVMALLEEIFELVLVFAHRQQSGGREDGGSENQEPLPELYSRFKGKIRVFISVCRGLTGKKGYGKGDGSAEENQMERLLLLLEMNGYYEGK